MKQIAVFPLSSPLLPGGRLPLRVFETRYLDLMRRHLKQQQDFAVALLSSGSEVATLGVKAAEVFPLATMAQVIDFKQGADACLHLLLQGVDKVELSQFDYQADGLLLAQAEPITADKALPGATLSDLELEQMQGLAEQILAHPELQSLQLQVPLKEDELAALLAQYLPFEAQDKYSLLSLMDSRQRLNKIVTLVNALS